MNSTEPHFREIRSEVSPFTRFLAEQAFSRAAGALLIQGNSVRLLKDAAENYPAWLDAIQKAARTIHFENYIVYEDEVGYQFAEALIAKARQGVHVRVLYDWMGAIGKTSRQFWQSLQDVGVEVRCFNPFRLSSPLGWISRNHRKMLAVDSHIGFVTGLCIGQPWVGNAAHGIEPWRDTGVEIRGPAIADIEQAFAQSWAAAGPPLPATELPQREDLSPMGDVSLRVIASEPRSAELYRLDTLIAAAAQHSLWLTDAYFVGTTTYVQALVAAAYDGVDVRLLVPGSSDIALVRALSRAGYRPLLEGGVRVFEWNGSMLHAKTAVADGHWARVGSTNLNSASWMSNWELDVAVENERFAKDMEDMFLQDLAHATEIVLSTKRRVYATGQPQPRSPSLQRRGSSSRAVAGALGISSAVGAAITNRRPLGPAEAKLMVTGGIILLVVSLVGVLWPRVLTIPFAVVSLWVSVALLSQAYKLHLQGKRTAASRTTRNTHS